jgi:tetratricopeptide (TPR) repeat protein
VLESRQRDQGADGDLVGAIGDAYAGLGRDGDAVRAYQQAYDMGGGAEWLARMARVDPQGALTRLQDAIDAAPEDAALRGALGDALDALGRAAEARAAYDEARRLADTTFTYEIQYQHAGP